MKRWIDEQKIRDSFSMTPSFDHAAAVLIPIVRQGDEWHVVFEVRSKTLRRQPGEISFPGGRIDEGETALEAVVRETVEELFVQPDQIEVIGQLRPLSTPNRQLIYPFVGLLTHLPDVVHTAEVDHVFTVELETLLLIDPFHSEMEWSMIPGENFPYDKVRNVNAYKRNAIVIREPFYEHGDYLIWGLTGKILAQFLSNLKENVFKTK